MVLGLQEYWGHFEKNSYSEPNDLADLKVMDNNTLSSIFNVRKSGHLKKLIRAIKHLEYPTTGKILAPL